MTDLTQQLEDKERKTDLEIKKEIIKCLVRKEWKNTLIGTIQKDINSNWITVEKFVKQLEKEGLVTLVRAEDRDKIVCVGLNKSALLLHEVLMEEPIELSEQVREILYD